ncbi:hypothetical protein FOZ63_008070, partial [Perkinsus olseni]
MSSGSSTNSKDSFPPQQYGNDAGVTTTGLVTMATMKNTFLDFGAPAPEVNLRQRSKTLPVVPNMKELLQSSLAKGALHHTSFDEEEEEEEDDDHTEVDADYTVLTPPERTALPSERDDAARSCRPEAAVGVHLSKPSPNSSSSATIDQLIAMQLLATLQTQQLQQGSTGVQFGLGSSPWRRGQPNDCGVESDDDFPISEASSSLGGSRGRDYTLVDLDKEIDVSPRKPRGHGLPPSGAPSNSVPARNNCGGTPTNDTDKTTVMLRNIPNKYTQRILLNSIDGRGFEGTYDF